MHSEIKENDWNGRCETPVGVAGQVRSRSGYKGRHANTTTSCRNACMTHIVWAQEAQRTPHGKRASCSRNLRTLQKVDES